MVRTRKQLKQEKLTYQLNNSGSFPKWIDFPLNIEQLNKIKRYNQHEMLGRSQLKEQEYSKWRKQGYRFVNLQNGKFSWRKNDFSYFIEQDLLHYILWYHGTWEGIEDILYIQESCEMNSVTSKFVIGLIHQEKELS